MVKLRVFEATKSLATIIRMCTTAKERVLNTCSGNMHRCFASEVPSSRSPISATSYTITKFNDESRKSSLEFIFRDQNTLCTHSSVNLVSLNKIFRTNYATRCWLLNSLVHIYCLKTLPQNSSQKSSLEFI